MTPTKSLPLPAGHANEEEYVEALLSFMTTSDMLQTLCGGVHILDHLTLKPYPYERIFPAEWRSWFSSRDIMEIIDFLMRADMSEFSPVPKGDAVENLNFSSPPKSLVEYVSDVRNLSFVRDFAGAASRPRRSNAQPLTRAIAVGMKVKKQHEVENFAAFVDDLVSDINQSDHHISHLIDFGSGQNYLGRVLAGPVYKRNVIAVESKQLNIDGARTFDVMAKLVGLPFFRKCCSILSEIDGKGGGFQE